MKSSGANYAYLGNTAGSNISVLNACKTAGVDVQFLGNVWGMDENAAKTAGEAADGVVFPLRTAVAWGGNAPGMKTVMEISKMSDADRQGLSSRALHRRRLHRAVHEGSAWNGPPRTAARPEKTSRRASTRKGLGTGRNGGRLQSSTWTEKDHRGTLKVDLYRMKISGATDARLNDLVKNGSIKLEKVKTVDLPRKAEWLGW